MKSEITHKTDTSTTLKINVDHEELKPIVKRTFDELRGRVKASGFRPGKAPDHIVERELGSGLVQSEVLEAAVMRSYADAVRHHELPVIAPPEVSVSKFVPYTELEYTAAVEVMPKIKLADYKKLKVAKPEVKIEDEAVEQVLQDLRRRLAKRATVERAAKKGDEVMIDFAGSQDGRPIEGGSATDYALQLGSDSFIPGFEDEIVGLKAGDEKDFSVSFPKDYRATSLAGKKSDFHVKLKQVTELVLPAVDDELAADASPFKTAKELKADIARRLLEEKEQGAAAEYEQTVLDRILKDSQYKLPQRMVEQQIERMKAEILDRLGPSGLDWDKYLQMAGQTDKAWEESAKPEAERRVALAMILTEIAREEKLVVAAEELSAEVNRLKQLYNDKVAQQELDTPQVREDVYNHLLASKTIAKILDYVEAN